MICYVYNLFFHSLRLSSCGGGGGGHPLLSQSSLLYAACDKFFTARITRRVSSKVKNCRFPWRVSRISFNSTVVQRLLRK